MAGVGCFRGGGGGVTCGLRHTCCCYVLHQVLDLSLEAGLLLLQGLNGVLQTLHLGALHTQQRELHREPIGWSGLALLQVDLFLSDNFSNKGSNCVNHTSSLVGAMQNYNETVI